MSAILECNSAGNSYSYQHWQGIMLSNFNQIAYKLSLTHSEYRVMATIIGLWNMKAGCAFPSVDYLATSCNMNKSTVIRAIKVLTRANLIKIIKTRAQRISYIILESLFEINKCCLIKPDDSSVKKSHVINKPIKNKNYYHQKIIQFNDNALKEFSQLLDDVMFDKVSYSDLKITIDRYKSLLKTDPVSAFDNNEKKDYLLFAATNL